MSSRDIKDCVPLLREFWPKLWEYYRNEFKDRELFLTCTLRSTDEQQELYKIGRRGVKGEGVVTQIDGVKKLSKHNPLPDQPKARAFDVGVKENGKVVWNGKYFVPLALVIDYLGYKDKIKWGGDFSFKDYPHFEVI